MPHHFDIKSNGCHCYYKATVSDMHNIKNKKKIQIEIHISIYIPITLQLKNGPIYYLSLYTEMHKHYIYTFHAVSSEVSFSVSALNFALSAPSYF